MKFLYNTCGLILGMSSFVLLTIFLPSEVNRYFNYLDKGVPWYFLLLSISIISLFIGKAFSRWLTNKRKKTVIFLSIVSCLICLCTLAFSLLAVALMGAGEVLLVEDILIEKCSPNGKLKATVKNLDGGAMSSTYTHVQILPGPNGKHMSNPLQAIYGKNETKVLVAQRGYGSEKENNSRATKVYIEWIDNQHLQVTHNNKAKVYYKDSNVQGIEV